MKTKNGTKVDIITGFLGAGKTTFIRALLQTTKERVAVLENEFGKIAIDGALLNGAGGVVVKELAQGCICCSLIGDFRAGIAELIALHAPERIIVEPTGVAMLSDVFAALAGCDVQIDRVLTIADARRADKLADVAGAFYADQLQNSNAVALSHTQDMDQAHVQALLPRIASMAQGGSVLCCAWDAQGVQTILQAAAQPRTAFHPPEQGQSAAAAFVAWGQPCAELIPLAHLRAMLQRLPKQGEILRIKGILDTDAGVMRIDGTPDITIQPFPGGTPTGLCIIGKGIHAPTLTFWFSRLRRARADCAD